MAVLVAERIERPPSLFGPGPGADGVSRACGRATVVWAAG